VDRYPFGPDTSVDLHCARRVTPGEEPVIKARANRPVKLIVEWAGGRRKYEL
jgi:hypothetical protein